jgi:Fe-S cluster assembly iron-binding protein IscA
VVSEKEGMNAVGSTIEFVIQDNKLKFRINEPRAKQQNLVLSKALIDMSV